MDAKITDIHLDAVGGIAGDMFVAAVLDALPTLRARVLADARAVLPQGLSARLVDGASGAVRALRFGLDGAHGHSHLVDTDYPALVTIIRNAGLTAGTADHAVAILTQLAQAEAVIHSTTMDHVHFHEIAGWDSLLDVVAAGSIAAALTGARWTVSTLPRGGGTVKTHHGLLPVPAPATAALLKGFAWRDDGVSGERVTPTGAAILRHLVTPDAIGTGGRLLSDGTGAGTRTLEDIPNILRALIFTEAAAAAGREKIMVISFDIDDMTGEEVAVAADRLRAADGVRDLTVGQCLGKKGRTMQCFRLLVWPDAHESVIGRCFAETSTIGLRLRPEERVVLPRRLAVVDKDGTTIGTKTVLRASLSSTKAESDDLAGDSLSARRRLKNQAEQEPA